MKKVPSKDYCLMRIGELDEQIMEFKEYFDTNAGKVVPEGEIERNIQYQRCAITAIRTRRMFAMELLQHYGITVMCGWEP